MVRELLICRRTRPPVLRSALCLQLLRDNGRATRFGRTGHSHPIDTAIGVARASRPDSTTPSAQHPKHELREGAQHGVSRHRGDFVVLRHQPGAVQHRHDHRPCRERVRLRRCRGDLGDAVAQRRGGTTMRARHRRPEFGIVGESSTERITKAPLRSR